MLSGAARPAYLATAVGAGGGGGGAGGADATGAAETLADGVADVTGGGGGGAGGGGSSPPHDAANSRANGSDVFLIDRIMAEGLLDGAPCLSRLRAQKNRSQATQDAAQLVAASDAAIGAPHDAARAIEHHGNRHTADVAEGAAACEGGGIGHCHGKRRPERASVDLDELARLARLDGDDGIVHAPAIVSRHRDEKIDLRLRGQARRGDERDDRGLAARGRRADGAVVDRVEVEVDGTRGPGECLRDPRWRGRRLGSGPAAGGEQREHGPRPRPAAIHGHRSSSSRSPLSSSSAGPKRCATDVSAAGAWRCSRRSARMAWASSSMTTRRGVDSTFTPSTASVSGSRPMSATCRSGSWRTAMTPP